jgi:hypothetical protein
MGNRVQHRRHRLREVRLNVVLVSKDSGLVEKILSLHGNRVLTADRWQGKRYASATIIKMRSEYRVCLFVTLNFFFAQEVFPPTNVKT